MDELNQHPPASESKESATNTTELLHEQEHDSIYNDEHNSIYRNERDFAHNHERESVRNHEREKAEVRKKFLKIGGVVALVLIGLFTLPIPLGSIKVVGSDKVTVQDVEVAGDIGEPVNILRINRETLRNRLSKDLRVEDAQISYELPLTMVVRIAERKGISVIPAQFGYLTLDKNGQVIASDSVIEDTTVPMISGVKGGNILLGNVVTDKPIVQVLDYLRALDDDTFKQIAEVNIGDPDNILVYTVSGIQIRLGDGTNLKDKAELTAAMLKDLPETQGKVEYIDVNPSSPYIKTDRITVQPKSNKNNKSKPDTSQSDKTDTSKQNDNTSKSKQD